MFSPLHVSNHAVLPSALPALALDWGQDGAPASATATATATTPGDARRVHVNRVVHPSIDTTVQPEEGKLEEGGEDSDEVEAFGGR